MALTVLLLFALAVPCHALDWKAFENPKTVLITDAFAKEINNLPAADKVAAIKQLHDFLKDKEVEIRRRAALVLGKLGDKSGVPIMIEDLAKATGADRDKIVVALRVLKDERAVPALRKALKDKSPYVRGIAVAALGELKAVQAYDDIVALTMDKEGKGPMKPGTLNCFPICPADMACYALGALGDKRAVPVLIELLPDRDLQDSALQALEVLSKQKFGNNPTKWKEWWKSQGQ
jgi:HEAT repeat protein